MHKWLALKQWRTSSSECDATSWYQAAKSYGLDVIDSTKRTTGRQTGGQAGRQPHRHDYDYMTGKHSRTTYNMTIFDSHSHLPMSVLGAASMVCGKKLGSVFFLFGALMLQLSLSFFRVLPFHCTRAVVCVCVCVHFQFARRDMSILANTILIWF